MAYDPSKYTQGPTEQELRIRAAGRVSRLRSFRTSALILGSLIVLNLFFYAQNHNTTWLLLDAFFAATLALRAWSTFGADHKEDADIAREVARMRQSAQPPVPPPPPSPATGPKDPSAGGWNV